jgi:hypothetical protein
MRKQAIWMSDGDCCSALLNLGAVKITFMQNITFSDFAL